MSKQPKGLAKLTDLRRQISALREMNMAPLPDEMVERIKSRRVSEAELRGLLDQTRTFYQRVASLHSGRETPGAATSASAAATSASAKKRAPKVVPDWMVPHLDREAAWNQMRWREEDTYVSRHKEFDWKEPVITAHTQANVLSKWLIAPMYDSPISITPDDGIRKAQPKIARLISEQFAHSGAQQIWITFECVMRSEKLGTYQFAYVASRKETIASNESIPAAIDSAMARVRNRIDELGMQGSDWSFEGFNSCEVYFAEYRPPQGGSYVELPARFKKSKALINVRNQGFDCIRYACAAIDHYAEANAKNRTKPGQYDRFLSQYINPYAALNQPFPCTEKAFAKYESDNHCRMFVYCFSNEHVVKSDDEITIAPLRISKKPEVEGEKAYYMLLIGGRHLVQDADGEHVEMNYELTHFVAIKNLARLLWSRSDDHHSRENLHVCPKCFYKTRKEDRWELHQKLQCGIDDHHAYLKMPKPGDKDHIVKFKAFKKQLWQPVVCYCDFEALSLKISNEAESRALTRQVAKHKASHIEIQVIAASQYEERCKKFGIVSGITGFNIIEHGEDFIARAIEFLFDVLKKRDLMQHYTLAMKQLTTEQVEAFDTADECHICKGKISPVEVKVRDHDHLTGEYRGPAHYACNAQFTLAKTPMPVYFHNGSNYDLHLIIHELAKNKMNVIKPIATSFEKYIAVEVKQDYEYEVIEPREGEPVITGKKIGHMKTGLEFMDTFRHITQSLDSMIAQMTERVDAKGCRTYCYDDLIHTKRQFGDKFELFAKKGTMPYEWLDSIEKLLQPFPDDIALWKNTLKGTDCDPEEFARCKRVYQEMGCRNMLDFQRHYTKSDVALLADAFEYYRKVVHREFGLDPANYLTAPSISWDAMLKYSGVRIENMTDLNMYLMVKQGIRGGISCVVNPYSKANHKNLPDYDPSKPSKFIHYFDANALYPTAMKKRFPTGDYKWVEIPAAPTGTAIADEHRHYERVIMEGTDARLYLVDTHTPAEHHDRMNDYPMTIGVREVDESELSPFVREQMLAYGVKPGKTGKKLIPSLDDQHSVLYHAENLKFMIAQGIEIPMIHKCVEYEASDFMEKFVSMMEDLRNKYKREGLTFMAEAVKLISNGCFGKSMEDITKRTDIRLETEEPRIRKLVSKFNMKSFRFLSDSCADLVGVEMERLSFVLNKPIMIGFCILEFSKLHMFKFYYEVLKPTYGERLHLLITDTDSLIIEVQTEDFYKDMREIPLLKNVLDLSSQSKKLPDGTPGAWVGVVGEDGKITAWNAGKYGKFKDECTKIVSQKISESQPEISTFDCISESVGIRSKMYDLELASHKHKGTAKGIGKAARDKFLKHAQYLEALAAAEAPMPESGLKQAGRIPMVSFVSKKHEISTQVVQKTGLVAINDKRYCLDARGYTLAYGHYRIAEMRTAASAADRSFH